MQLRPLVLLGLGLLQTGDSDGAQRALSQAIQLAQRFGIKFADPSLTTGMAQVLLVKGQLEQADRLCQESLNAIGDNPVLAPAEGQLRMTWARILYERDELENALKQLRQGLDMINQLGSVEGVAVGYALLAMTQLLLGDRYGAQSAIRQAVQLALGSNIDRIVQLIMAYQARFWLLQGLIDPAKRWAAEYKKIKDTEYLREFEDLTLVRVYLASGRTDTALSVLAQFEDAGRNGTMIDVLALQAIARREKDLDSALEYLGRSLALAEPEGYCRLYVDHGEPMRHLLTRIVNSGLFPDYGQKLLKGFRTSSRKEADDLLLVQPIEMIEPLTAREFDVLNLLAAGHTNKEIADKLFISIHTVKTHARHLYEKLQVRGRRQAVYKARELGLIL
jgi:LuxR family maltose regulon positive regulatory protein